MMSDLARRLARVNMYLRWLLMNLKQRRAPRLAYDEVAATPFRVGLADLDVLRHMNNGRYLTCMDLGRLDLMQRAGIWREFKRRGWYPVVVAQTITYRRSLELGQRFAIESAMLGFDERAAYLEQRFVSGGEIVARAFVRARMLKRGGGRVSVAELHEAFPRLPDRLPESILAWAEGSALPTVHEEAPSVWPVAPR